jgi:DNA polymerase-3 subunit epsilon
MSLWSKYWPGKSESSRSKNLTISQTTQDYLKKYLQVKQPIKKTLLKDAQLIAVDFETTGLDSKNDEILSMGFCPIKNFTIRLADCLHIIIKPTKSLNSDNVVIHGLTDDQVSQGVSAEQAMATFLELTQGKVIVAHYHSIEKNFIQKLARQVLGCSIPINLFDTYAIAEQRMLRRNQVISSGSLRLFNLRKELGLPNYNAHNALEDAISTAELFLAQVASLNMPLEAIQLNRLGLIRYNS